MVSQGILCFSAAGNLPYWYINGTSYTRTDNTLLHLDVVVNMGTRFLALNDGYFASSSSPSTFWWDERARSICLVSPLSRATVKDIPWLKEGLSLWYEAQVNLFYLVVAYYIWCDVIHLRMVTLATPKKSPSPVGLKGLGRIWSFLEYNARAKWQRLRLGLASNLFIDSRTRYLGTENTKWTACNSKIVRSKVGRYSNHESWIDFVYLNQVTKYCQPGLWLSQEFKKPFRFFAALTGGCSHHLVSYQRT